MKVLLKRFHFNCHTARLGPQSQRLDSPYKTVDIITHYWSVNESAQVTCAEASAPGFKFPTLGFSQSLQLLKSNVFLFLSPPWPLATKTINDGTGCVYESKTRSGS